MRRAVTVGPPEIPGNVFGPVISRDAHHPPDLSMANRDVIIINNRIETVSQVYKDNSAILSTYVAGTLQAIMTLLYYISRLNNSRN